MKSPHIIDIKGSPLSCVWCHNPESRHTLAELSFDPQKCISRKSCITNDYCRCAAHPVLGAVMGSKNLKAVALAGKTVFVSSDLYKNLRNLKSMLYNVTAKSFRLIVLLKQALLMVIAYSFFPLSQEGK